MLGQDFRSWCEASDKHMLQNRCNSLRGFLQRFLLEFHERISCPIKSNYGKVWIRDKIDNTRCVATELTICEPLSFFSSSYAGTANTCNTGDASNRPVTFKAFLEKTCSTSAASNSVNQYTCGDKCEFTISIIHANCWSAHAHNIPLCIYDSTLQHWWRFHKRMQLWLRHRHKFNEMPR